MLACPWTASLCFGSSRTSSWVEWECASSCSLLCTNVSYVQSSLASMLMVHVSQVQNALPERTWSQWECEIFRLHPGYLASIIFVFALLNVEHAQSDSQVEALWCMIWFPLFGVLVWFDTSTKTIVSESFVWWIEREAEQLSLSICTGRAVHLSQKSCKFDMCPYICRWHWLIKPAVCLNHEIWYS